MVSSGDDRIYICPAINLVSISELTYCDSRDKSLHTIWTTITNSASRSSCNCF